MMVRPARAPPHNLILTAASYGGTSPALPRSAPEAFIKHSGTVVSTALSHFRFAP